MILEVAQVRIKPGQAEPFEAAFPSAARQLASAQGYISHELHRCIERPDHYLLLVRWQRVEDHTVGFRGSELFQEWRRLMAPFYDGLPAVLHYEIGKAEGR